MKELHAAVELEYQLAQSEADELADEFGNDETGEYSDEVKEAARLNCNARLAVAKFSKDLTDPTPLSELTDEQWRGINAERKGSGWSVPVGENVIAYMLAADRLAIHWGYERTPLMFKPTLGQLRALMFALGGR